jgi:hypothetical protein
MLTLGLLTPNPKDATSVYRAWGPWTAVKREICLHNMTESEVSWVSLANIDCLFLHRPYSSGHSELVNRAKSMNIPIVLDFDDDLLNVHPSNPSFGIYSDPSVQHLIKMVISKADVVIVSTAELKKIYEPFAKQVIVIKNKLPSHLIPEPIYANPKALPRKTVLWRGTPHHDVNLRHYEKAIGHIMRTRRDYTWTFFGHRPWQLADYGHPHQVHQLATNDAFTFYHELRNLHSRIQVVPLVNNSFNRAKSNIAYLEGCGYARSVLVVPDLPEWKGLPGTVSYEADNITSFRDATLRAMDLSQKQWDMLSAAAHEYVLSSGLVQEAAEERLKLLYELCE